MSLSSNSSKLVHKDYILTLDGIRAIAIGLVLIYHWFPQNSGINIVPNGPLGVTLFFVLSGFLITSILIKSREKVNFSLFKTYKIFLIRRALRIFPIYFLTLLILMLLVGVGIKLETDFYQHPFYYWFYLYNQLLERTHNWNDVLSPFWSLAVEEQFYIFWAIIVLNLSNIKYQKIFFWSMVLAGPLLRLYFIYYHGSIGVMTATCIDTFAWGALLSLYSKQNDWHKYKKYLTILAILSALLLTYIVAFTNDKHLVKILFFRTAVSCLSVTLIIWAMEVKSGLFYQIMSSKIVTLMGKISYGIYVYHMVIPLLFNSFVNRLHWSIPGNTQIVALIVLLVTSYLSWIIIEKPINNLKRFFEYD